MTRLYILGDIHSDWRSLNTFINKKRPEVIFQCGDFGYWPHIKEKGKPMFYRKAIKNKDTQIYWCPGNHENWDMIEDQWGRHGREPVEIENTEEEPHTNIFYCPIGSIVKINGLTWMFIGGAESIDKSSRKQGYSWWPQETLWEKDLDYILSYPERVDGVISHTVPLMFDVFKSSRYDKMIDPSCRVLDIVIEKLRPKYWRAGHWHFFMQGNILNCNWKILDHSYSGGIWWEKFY